MLPKIIDYLSIYTYPCLCVLGMDTRPIVVAVWAALVMGAVLMLLEDRVTVLLAGELRTLTTAWHSEGPKKPKSALYSSAISGALRICFNMGGQHFWSMARM